MLKYFKLDWKCLRSTIGWHYIWVPVFLLVYFFLVPEFSVNFSFFFMLIFTSMPFSIDSSERTAVYYHSLPGTSREMVLGRYLFPLCMLALISIWNLLVLSIPALLLKLIPLDLSVLPFLGICAWISLLVALIQYPLYYKFGLQKSKIITMVIYIVPAFLLFSLPSASDHIAGLDSTCFQYAGFWVLLLAIDLFAGLVSYFLSYHIVKNKDIA
mgnify:CR=1 FL=1